MTSSLTPKLVWSCVVVLLFVPVRIHSASLQNLEEKKQLLETGLKGTVFDPLEARGGRARITVESKSIKRELDADEMGNFSLKLPPGTYQIVVESPGFQVAKLKKKVRVGEGISEVRVVLKVKKIKYGKCPGPEPCIWL